jgi:predicted DsbA family dithiol-disulfide isomerase
MSLSQTPMPVPVTVVSDVVCPWCYVGKRNLETALADIPRSSYVIDWRPHQLDPSLPPEGVDRKAYMANKFKDPGKLFAIQQTLMEVAVGAGLAFNFDRIALSPNTLNAHRVIHWARGQNLDSAMVEQIMKAYFIDGRDVGDAAILAELAGEAGLEIDLIANLLASDADRAAVELDIEKYRKLGVTGVPCFIFGGTVAVMGAQSPEILRKAFDQVQTALA